MELLTSTSAEHFQQCAEFLPLRNRGLGPLAVTVLPIPLTTRAATTACAAVQPTSPAFWSLATGMDFRSWFRAPHLRGVAGLADSIFS